MAYIQVEASVRTHKKFLKAGPAPSWLWLCGLAYCQEGLTDGFIPTEALMYLGVKNAKQLAAHLVAANLWEVVEGGWQVHDYLQYNKSAATVNGIKKTKREAGKAGGLASGEARREAPASTPAEAPREPISSLLVSSQLNGVSETPQTDVWLLEFLKAYPGQGQCASHLLGTAFFAVVGTDRTKFDALIARLEQHKRSAQWQAGKIPRADRYLREGLHMQTLPEVLPSGAPVASPRRPAWAVKP